MARVSIKSSYSAQPSSSKPNPFVETSIHYIVDHSLAAKRLQLLDVADQGCGKLRHLPVLAKYFRRITLVETTDQLNRRQKLFEVDNVTIAEYISTTKQRDARVISADRFARTRLALDLIFNVCVLDVEVPHSGQLMFRAAAQNLRLGGLFVLIVLRNDQTILVRCTAENKYQDGHVFHHHGIATFYRNFRDQTALVNVGAGVGLSVIADLSVYRQICLIFSRQSV
jgi:SAM-dependent methyltransferase